MSFRFEKLEAWQDARQFSSKVYRVTASFPKAEIFGLTNQLRRAAVSIALNIAEGSDRKSDKEFIRFLRTAITSAEEVVTGLYIALDQKYFNQKKFEVLYQDANIIVAKINALINSLNKQ